MKQIAPITDVAMEKKQRDVAVPALKWKNPISRIEARLSGELIRNAMRSRARMRFFVLVLWPRMVEVLIICVALYWVHTPPGVRAVFFWPAKIAVLGYAILKLAYQTWKACNSWRRLEAKH